MEFRVRFLRVLYYGYGLNFEGSSRESCLYLYATTIVDILIR